MSTQAQINGNRKNAEGGTKFAANSTHHGLQAHPTTIFENNPFERSQYDALKEKPPLHLLASSE